jgi:hypothetical protein
MLQYLFPNWVNLEGSYSMSYRPGAAERPPGLAGYGQAVPPGSLRITIPQTPDPNHPNFPSQIQPAKDPMLKSQNAHVFCLFWLRELARNPHFLFRRGVHSVNRRTMLGHCWACKRMSQKCFGFAK